MGPLESQVDSLLGANREDSYATQASRGYALRDAARMLQEKFGLQKLSNLGQKHVAHVVQEWRWRDAGKRSIESKLSHLRWAVMKIGKANLMPRTNAQLGISPGPRCTRAGKTVSKEELNQLLGKIQDPRLQTAMLLARHLGLRFREAMLLRPGKDWDGDRVWVKRGTKGGRPRYLFLHNSAQREVLQRARLLVRGDGALIPKEYATFEKWRQHCYRQLRAAGMSQANDRLFHDSRRTYAVERMKDLMQRCGLLRLNAAQLVSRELGHGRTEILNWYIGAEAA